MEKESQNGSDCTNENDQLIELAYTTSCGNRRSTDLSKDPIFKIFKKMVKFFLKENTDFYVFSENLFCDLFCEVPVVEYNGLDLDYLESYELIKLIQVSDEDENGYYVVWLKDISQYVDDWTAIKSYYETQKRTRFKFRAEWFHQVMEFFSDFPTKFWDVKIEQSDGLPDTDCEFTTYMSLKEVLLYLKSIVDSHVMMDTLN